MSIRVLFPLLFALAVLVFDAATTARSFRTWTTGGDFKMRRNEILCVREGVNPYDVFARKVESPRWRHLHDPDDPGRPRGRVNGYAPWEYTFMFPFSLVGEKRAFATWTALGAAAHVALFFLSAAAAWRRLPESGGDGRRDGLRLSRSLWCGALALCTGKAFRYSLQVGNFGAFLPVLVFAAAWALNRRRDVLAGLFLALLCVKPQIGALFFLPLALRRRFVPAAVAAAVLAIATLPPAALCGVSPFVLLRGVAEHGDSLTRATGLFPPGVFARLSAAFGARATLLASAAAGAALCAAADRTLRRESDWLAVLTVPATLSLFWTYGLAHDRCLLAPAMLFAGISLFRARDWRGRVLPALVVAVVPGAIFAMWQAIPTFWPLARVFDPAEGAPAWPAGSREARIAHLASVAVPALSVLSAAALLAAMFALWRRLARDRDAAKGENDIRFD